MNSGFIPNLLVLMTLANILMNNKNSSGKVISENWNCYTNPSWYDSIIEGYKKTQCNFIPWILEQ